MLLFALRYLKKLKIPQIWLLNMFIPVYALFISYLLMFCLTRYKYSSLSSLLSFAATFLTRNSFTADWTFSWQADVFYLSLLFTVLQYSAAGICSDHTTQGLQALLVWSEVYWPGCSRDRMMRAVEVWKSCMFTYSFYIIYTVSQPAVL